MNCRKCGKKLESVSELKRIIHRDYICDACRRYYFGYLVREADPIAYRLRVRDWKRRRRIGTSHGDIIGDKRPFKGVCEICGLPLEKGLIYHHWDDGHPEWGIWCHKGTCHIIAEATDRGLAEKYLKLKREISGCRCSLDVVISGFP